MRFTTPGGQPFEIPDEWWACADMDEFATENSYYPCASGSNIQIVAIGDIEPPSRNPGVAPFKKHKLIPVLFGFRSMESRLPPVKVLRKDPTDRYHFRVYDGYHRYYASIAVGYESLPVVVLERAP